MPKMDNKWVEKLYNTSAYEQPLTPLEQDLRDRDQLDRFLNITSMIESSGGKNTKHKEIQSGIHAGDQAIGQYGLMPNTIKEIVSRQVREGNNEMSSLLPMDNQQLSSTLQEQPKLQQKAAEYLGRRLLDKYEGDEEKSTYAWQMGHNKSPEQIEQEDYENSPRVKKYQRFNNLRRNIASDESQ